MDLTNDGVPTARLSSGHLKDTRAVRSLEQFTGPLGRQIVEEKIPPELIEHVGDNLIGARGGVLRHVACTTVVVAPSTRTAPVTWFV